MKLNLLALLSITLFACAAPVAPVDTAPVIPPTVEAPAPELVASAFPAWSSSWGLKQSIYNKGVAYYAKNKAAIKNQGYFMMVDFNLHSSKRRLFLFDMSSKTVAMHNVSAGKNSDPDGDGFATIFSNVSGSNASSLGFYKTAETYNGSHGLSLKLDGLESTNSKARARAVAMHPADYVKDGASAGRSWGCPAIDPRVSAAIIGKVKGGAILLIDR